MNREKNTKEHNKTEEGDRFNTKEIIQLIVSAYTHILPKIITLLLAMVVISLLLKLYLR